MIEGTNNNLKKSKKGNRDFFAFFSSSRQRDKNIEISMFFEEVYMRLSVSADFHMDVLKMSIKRFIIVVY